MLSRHPVTHAVLTNLTIQTLAIDQTTLTGIGHGPPCIRRRSRHLYTRVRNVRQCTGVLLDKRPHRHTGREPARPVHKRQPNTRSHWDRSPPRKPVRQHNVLQCKRFRGCSHMGLAGHCRTPTGAPPTRIKTSDKTRTRILLTQHLEDDPFILGASACGQASPGSCPQPLPVTGLQRHHDQPDAL